MHALPPPRIVRLEQKQLRQDDDPKWGKTVSSNREIGTIDRSLPYFEDIPAVELERRRHDEAALLASKRYEDHVLMDNALIELLGWEFCGGDGSDILNGMIERGRAQYAHAIWESTFECCDPAFPVHLMGFRSDQPVPAVLSACRESNTVACQFYTRAFSSVGALAETYFDLRTTPTISMLEFSYSGARNIHTTRQLQSTTCKGSREFWLT